MTDLTPQDNQRLMAAVLRIESQGEDIADIKSTMRELAVAFTKLAIFDERQANDRAEISRIFKKLEAHDERIKTMELAEPEQKKSAEWVDKAMGLVMTAVVSAVVSLVLIKPNAVLPLPTQNVVETRK